MRKINLQEIAELPTREQQRIEQYLRGRGLSNQYYPKAQVIRARKEQDEDESTDEQS